MQVSRLYGKCKHFCWWLVNAVVNAKCYYIVQHKVPRAPLTNFNDEGGGGGGSDRG